MCLVYVSAWEEQCKLRLLAAIAADRFSAEGFQAPLRKCGVCTQGSIPWHYSLSLRACGQHDSKKFLAFLYLAKPGDPFLVC